MDLPIHWQPSDLREDGSSQKNKVTDNHCINNTESYAFWITWSIINYFIVLVFAILLLTWYDISQKSIQIRKNVIELLRQLDLSE